MKNLKTYKFKGYLGITDLKGIIGELDQWTSYTEEELKEFDTWNKEYIASLKAEGRYGEEYETSLTLIHNPLFDEPIDYSKFSTRVTFINFKQK